MLFVGAGLHVHSQYHVSSAAALVWNLFAALCCLKVQGYMSIVSIMFPVLQHWLGTCLQHCCLKVQGYMSIVSTMFPVLQHWLGSSCADSDDMPHRYRSAQPLV